MEIEYLKLMKATPEIEEHVNRSVKVEDIDALEQKIGKTFPKAYREFLYLGGEHANMMSGNHGFYHQTNKGVSFIEEVQKEIVALLKLNRYKLKSDYWAINSQDDGASFHFFNFDEGDDPPVYWFCMYHLNEHAQEYVGVKEGWTSFGEMIDKLIKMRTANKSKRKKKKR